MMTMYTASITRTNGAKVFGASHAFRWFVKKSGEKVLQQAWQETQTGEIEWREIGTVHE